MEPKLTTDEILRTAIAAQNDALTYCRLALTALEISHEETGAILSSLIGRLVDAGARDFMEGETP